MTKKGLSILGLAMLMSWAAAAQSLLSGIDVQHYTFNIQLNDQNNSISGQAEVAVKFLTAEDHFQLNLVKKNVAGKGMTVLAVTEEHQPVHFTQDSAGVNIFTKTNINSIHHYLIRYEGIPADGLIISTNKFGKRTFFGDNWPNRAQNWLPCHDHPSDKASVDFVVTAPDHYQVVANGLKLEEKALAGHLKLTHWQETVNLPTKVMVIGVADFAISQSGTVSGTPVYSYVYPQNETQGFKDYAFADKILPFYIQHIGAYPYKKLANVQSTTIFGGMENASAIFYFENSVGDRGVESLIAHEIAHQWFGDAVTEVGWQHLWLSEGFATYMTNCYLEHTYGVDSLKHILQQQRQKVLGFEKKRLTPVIDTAVTSNYMQLLNANSYEKGAWILHMLRRKIGDAAFWEGIHNYFAKYSGHNASSDNFKLVMEQAGKQNLGQFFDQWLRKPGHPKLAVNWSYDVLKKTLNIQVNQQQANLYTLPLEYSVNGKVYSMLVTDKVTTLQLPLAAKPAAVEIDPHTNLLAEYEVKQLTNP
ncbi:M1 family metallopeptidase [Pedobacter sp. L105]|uniref:M1 family metallopeptidase n=1 Tax=Pedobacter sp. L105 TaxID=1641871 RepID=UPI00131C4F26|nr:M1 family metallopeptidase [Pedobacter sp. L105]